MILRELRNKIGKANFDKVPDCCKVYINVDSNEISVGLPKSYLFGMRAAVSIWKGKDYLTFKQLLKDDEAIYTISDGKYDVDVPKGTRVPLAEDLDSWEVYLSDKIKSELGLNKQIKLSAKGKEYLIEAEDFEISIEEKHSMNESIKFSDAKVYENGKEITDFGSNFVGREFYIDDVVSQLIRNYINGGVSGVKAIEVYNPRIEEVKKYYEQDQVTVADVTRNKKFMGSTGYLPLDMINKTGFAYYSDGDDYVLLRDDMSVATDIEDFYMSSFIEDIEDNNYDYLDEEIDPKDYL